MNRIHFMGAVRPHTPTCECPAAAPEIAAKVPPFETEAPLRLPMDFP